MPPPVPEQRRLRVLLCGYGHLGLALLQGLLSCADKCEVVGVFRWSSRPDSANCWEAVEGVLQTHVQEAGLRDIQCPGMNSYEFSSLLTELSPDVILVGAWGEIIKPHLLEREGVLLVNCHPSKLPAHRGANPYSSVIRERETETGVTFHRMVKAIDAGAVLLQRSVPLTEYEHGASVRDKCVETAQAMVPELLDSLCAHVLAGEALLEAPQEEAHKSYFPALQPSDGLINWSHNMDQLFCQIRALYPWVVCYSFIKAQKKILFYDPRFVPGEHALAAGRAPGEIVAYQRGHLLIATAEPGYLLEVSTFQIAWGRSNLPVLLGKILGLWWFRPGQRFGTPK